MGLNDGVNEGFTAWVEPYAFSTGGGMGTAATGPVYDRAPTGHVYRSGGHRLYRRLHARGRRVQLRDGVECLGHAVDGALLSRFPRLASASCKPCAS